MTRQTFASRTTLRIASKIAGLTAIFAAFGAVMTLHPGSASAQTARFPAEDFGKVVLPHRETTGAAVNYIRQHGNAFEPIAQLREDSPIRKISRAIGRLDMLVENGNEKYVTNCTGGVVARDLILTNYHCIPGLEGKVTRALFLVDYLTADGKGAFHLELDVQPVEADAALDFALIRIKDKLPDDIPVLALETRRPLIKERLVLVHHPAGLVKMMTQFRCIVSHHTPETGTVIRHLCDTQPGSSGAILFNETLGAIGIHHSGGLTENDPESFNEGTITHSLLASAKTKLATVAASGAGASSNAASEPGKTQAVPALTQEDAAGRINKILGQ